MVEQVVATQTVAAQARVQMAAAAKLMRLTVETGVRQETVARVCDAAGAASEALTAAVANLAEGLDVYA